MTAPHHTPLRTAAPTSRRGHRRKRPSTLKTLGVLLVTVIAGLVLLGPLAAPHPPNASIGAPFSPPSAGSWLGTDALGRDVLSRVLSGGRSVIGLAATSITITYLIAVPTGMALAWVPRRMQRAALTGLDLVMAIPSLLVLLLVATSGSSVTVLLTAIVIAMTPAVARVVHSVTLEVRNRAYVEVAIATGEPLRRVLRCDVWPNLVPIVVATAGVRFTTAIYLVAAGNFLGLGLQPPTADWALMVSENSAGIVSQPWSVAAPAALLASLLIGVNLVADALERPSQTGETTRG